MSLCYLKLWYNNMQFFVSGRWPLILSILGCNWFWCRRKYKPLVSQGVKSGQMREEKKHAEVGKRVRNTRKDQSMAGVINFILTGVHAACMHCMQSACRAVKIELKPGLILMRVPDAPQSALIIRMDMQSSLTALHASCMHCMQTCQDCECSLKSKSLSDMWLPDLYPMQGFLWKGGSICKKLCCRYHPHWHGRSHSFWRLPLAMYY